MRSRPGWRRSPARRRRAGRLRIIYIMSCAPAFRAGVWPPSLAALATALPSITPWQLSALRPPPAGLYARPAASVRNGSQSYLLARSRSGQLPLPAPACGGHAKPSVPLTFRASERRHAALAGLASPHPADASPAHSQAVARLRAALKRGNDRR
ncbi:uncharacterized protein EpC_29000 [Erwinia pyrifoliae Ep1/96]|nr:uncharacterized protein EpC_29000 [Erwinia pyrifoliae Ep1/96]